MEARFGLAGLYRHSGDLVRAEEVYERHAKWAERQHVFEGSIFAHMGLAMVGIAQNDMLKVYEQGNQCVRYLDKVPGHWLWAVYRLIVATMLAIRGDEARTYQWLWNANELGLGDTVDADTALNLMRIFDVACENQWSNVVRVAGKLAVGQLERLGLRQDARAVKRRMTEALS